MADTEPLRAPFESFDQEALIHRLSYALKTRDQEVVFLLGAGLSAPAKPGGLGVPNANGVIDLIRAEFASNPEHLEAFEKSILGPATRQYQAAFRFLQGRLGQPVANEIVRRAVLQARTKGALENADTKTDEGCRSLEFDSGWALAPGTEYLGKLLTEYMSRFGHVVLTTNFDPLIEISIRNAGGQLYRTTLDSDGSLSQTEASGSHVVHLHGYWYGCDTLHTDRQLEQARPHLKASLSRLLRKKLFVVCGYAGWDDIFSTALMAVVEDVAAQPEVLWLCHRAEPDLPEPLIARLRPYISRGRISLYAGIDCNTFFPALHHTWLRLETPSPRPKGIQTNAVRVGEGLQKQLAEQKTIQPILEGDDEDRPPMFEFCVGREHELRNIRESPAKVVFLSGIGGQGKSTVAAKYFAECQAAQTFGHFVWRDCKEEAERFENQLASVVETLSGGSISGEDLAKQNATSIVQLLFNVVGNRPVLFVFDNADHYVNLETGQMTASADALIQFLLKSDSQSRVLLTSRPSVNYHHLFALSCELQGISLDAARQLFERRGVTFSDSEISELHDLTQGHAFWLDLLAIQAAKTPSVTLQALVERIRSGGENLLEDKLNSTLSSIWATLKEREQIVLRSMAETVRPVTEEEITEYVQHSMNYAKALKALKALRALNLVVIKRAASNHDVLELHPLVRQFIRSKFSQTERSQFIEQIIKVFRRFIGSHKLQLKEHPTLSLLQYWTHTVELDVAAGRTADAFMTLSEVAYTFSGSAYPREFCRAARLLLASFDWLSRHGAYRGFDGIFKQYIETLEDLGETREVDELLDKFEMTVLDRDARYILYCGMKCYCKWLRGQFADAVMWGKKGQILKTSSKVDTSFDASHNLALAERDAGHPESALQYFLHGQPLAQVVDPEIFDSDDPNSINSGAYYGNIGRCLYFMGQTDSALICYQKSALSIERERVNEHFMNQGYIRRWVAEALAAQSHYKLAAVFLEAARLKWKLVSPPNALRVATLQKQIVQQVPPGFELPQPEQIERLFRDWVRGRYIDDQLP